ncbi:MAG: sensory box histidine kinase [Sphingobacteriales bacterium]|nr:sensory box histidine kinase [Sphingobacteriales bacterium]
MLISVSQNFKTTIIKPAEKKSVSRRTKKRPVILSYAFAVLTVIIALNISLWMNANFHTPATTSLLLCAVIFSTWFGGVRQGWLSIALSVFAFDYYFLSPSRSLVIESEHFLRILLFMGPSIFIVWLSSIQKSISVSLRNAHDALEETVEKLVQNETKLKEAQAIAHIGNWEIGIKNGITIWSDEAYKIFGIEPEEVQPTVEMFLSLVHPDDLAFVKSKIEHSFLTLTSTNFDFRFIRKDGEIRYGFADTRFELDEDKTPIRRYGVLKDVTEQKIAEEKKEKVLKSLEEILFITSHKVRHPVANILGIATLLDGTDISHDELKNLVDFIKISAQSLDDFTRELTEFVSQMHKTQEKEVVGITEE